MLAGLQWDRWFFIGDEKAAASETRPSLPCGPVNQNAADTRASYWASVRGTTERRPMRTRGESANSFLDLISARVTGLLRGLPALMFTAGTFGLEASTETTVAVPTADFVSPVS